jgi:hypothetical protein
MKKYLIVVLSVIIIVLIFFTFVHRSFVFKANIAGAVFNADRCVAICTSNQFQILATQSTPDAASVMIYFNATKVGTYMLNSDNLKARNVGLFYTRGGKFLKDDSSFTGNVTVTKLDFEKKKVSGTFLFQAVRFLTAESKVINVADGTFEDIPFKFKQHD